MATSFMSSLIPCFIFCRLQGLVQQAGQPILRSKMHLEEKDQTGLCSEGPAVYPGLSTLQCTRRDETRLPEHRDSGVSRGPHEACASTRATPFITAPGDSAASSSTECPVIEGGEGTTSLGSLLCARMMGTRPCLPGIYTASHGGQSGQ